MARSTGVSAFDTVMANFIAKLWKIVDNPEYTALVSWTNDGKTFIVYDEIKFSKEILPLHFKHNNFNSFVRQLNLYGFHKMGMPDHGGLARFQDVEPAMFWHTNFRRGHPELLHLVQRRIPPNKASVGGGGVDQGQVVKVDTPHHLSEVMSDIHQMKGRQEGIATILETLKQDNTHLRHEISILKDKHIRQQKVLNKIIHFLVHMVYNKGKIPPSAPRRPNRSTHLMLMGTEEQAQAPLTKKMKMAASEPVNEFSVSDMDQNDLSDFYNSPLTSLLTDLPPPLVPPTSLFPVSSAVSSVPSEAISTSPSTLTSLSSPPASVPSVYMTTPDKASPSAVLSSPTEKEYMNSVLPSNPLKDSITTSSVLVSSDDLQYPQIPQSLLLEDYPIPPAPSSLVHVPHPEKMCLNGQLNHQQLGLNNLPELLSGHFSLDPTLISEFVMSELNPQPPEYDYTDTARLLESLTYSDDSNIASDGMLNFGSLLPLEDEAVEKGVKMQDPFLSVPDDSVSLQLPVSQH